jgi:pyruvate formate lyase activating enzyme
MATGTDRFASRQHGWIWDIKRYALHDGPGIRTTVFVKGCPLRCQWCCNPESQSFRPEAAWIGERCLNCGLCEQVCPHGAISHDGGRRYVDHQLCDLCGECARRCPGEALQIMGRRVFVDEVLAEISRDSVFFSRSGGGLTISGGEPLAQPEFVAELLRRYKTEEKGLSTAVETCGHAEWPMVARVGRYTDLFLFDLKHMDPGEHFRLTGVGNRLILENAARLAESGHTLVIRLPLIPA